MTQEQLNILGAPDQPEDLALGPVQREVMREVRRLGTLTRDEAGALAHAHRGKHAADEACAWCSIDGALVLDSLLKRRLAERGADGAVQLPRVPDTRQTDSVPY